MAEQELEFEWDQAKAKSNLEKHGVSFFTAAAIFQNERLERIDDREDYGESPLDRTGPRRPRGLPGRIYLARREPCPHHQRPEGK